MAKIKSYIHIALLLCIGLALGSCTKWNYHDGGVAYGVHDCSMWDYFKKQPRDWDSTRVMIQHAGLQDLFEGKGEYGSRSEATGEKTGGKTYTLMDGSEAFLWTFQESYLGVGNAGAVHLWFFIEKFATSRRIYSSNIQTENGVVQALGHDFLFE